MMVFPNSLTFDSRGNLYVTDSATGTIWRITRSGAAAPWLQHELLEGLGQVPGFPPIGANGIVYWKGILYVANTEKGLILRISIGDGSVTELATIADGLDEPASLAFGTQDGNRQAVFLTNFSVMPEDGGAGPALLKIEIGVPGRPLP